MAQRFGRYEVVDRVGAGGMGEVYRARDSELKRDVAVKVLRDKIQSSPEHQKRFLQEARSASALNHPNIVTVHDIGSEDGVSFIVSEFVEGQSLRLLLGGTLSTRKIINIAVDISSALAAAHRAGIIHRDLKPENVMIASDGRVKLLDFGLAKLLPVEPVEDQETITELVSKEGIIRGTVPYMSPEQAADRSIDFRTDQFSFGCMLYEMLTGKRPFDRATPAQTLSAIIEEDPPAIANAERMLPPPLKWAVERCLAKEPAQRYDSTGDLHRDLLKIQQHFSEVTSSETIHTAARRRFHVPSWIAFAFLPLAVLGGIVWSRITHRNDPPVFHQLTFRRGYLLRPRFGPDGQSVYYTAVWDGQKMQPYVTRVNNPESTPLPYENALIQAVSDSGDVALSIDQDDGSNILAVTSIAGGAPRQLLNNVSFSDWSPANHQLLVAREVDDRLVLEFPIGKTLYDPGSASTVTYPRFSPSGDRVAFVQFDDRDGKYSIRTIDLQGKTKILSSNWGDIFGLAWTPKGNEIWFGAREAATSGALTLRAVDMSSHVRRVAGVPGVLIISDIAKDGRALVIGQNWPGEMMCNGPGMTTERELSWFDESFAKVLSPDGKKIVFREEGVAGGSRGSVFIRDTDAASPAVRLSDGNPYALSPDQKWVMADLSPISGVCTMVPTGPGENHTVNTGGLDCFCGKWLSDGKGIVFLGKPKQSTSWRWYRTDIHGAKPRAITLEGPLNDAVLSDNDRQLFWKNKSGEIKEYSTNELKELTLPWKLPADARLLAVTNNENALYAATGQVPVQIFRYDLTSGAKQLWKELSPIDRSGVETLDVFIAPQADYYCYSFIRNLSDLYEVEGLK
jgi:serine/threonine protein kinase/WD40 repeat protein